MELNVNVKPYIKVLVRKEFLYNFEKGHGEFEEGYIFAACAMKSRPLLFHVHLKSGAKFIRLPITAFCTKQDAPPVTNIGDLELWDCLSGNLTCMQYEYFKNYEVHVKLHDGIYSGIYVTTFDFIPSGGLEESPDQHKDFNLILLDNGNFALQPNNKLFFIDEHFTGSPTSIPDYKAIQEYFLVEREDFRDYSNDEGFYYNPAGKKLE